MAFGVSAKLRQMTMVGGCSAAPGDTQTKADNGNEANGKIGDVEVSTQIYKDGYWMVGCMADGMYAKGDKFGDGAMAYEKGYAHDTSIVRYDVHVERESKKKMTPRVCFDFCRSVPEMTFFGLINGRECYCAHFYKTTTGDGACDRPCEGDSSTICGGETMSTLYQMHECVGAFADDVQSLIDDAEDVYDALDDNYDALSQASTAMQASGDELESFTEGCASPLAQEAKIAAGPVKRAAEKVYALAEQYEDLVAELNPSNDLGHEDRVAVEEAMAKTVELMDDSEQALAAGKAMMQEAAPQAEGAKTGETFVPVLRQIKPDLADDQSVCGGDLTGMPKVGLSYDECAEACDNEAPKSSDEYCKFIQYFTFPSQDSLCFLFSAVTELTSYNCKHEGVVPAGKFLQKKHKLVRKEKAKKTKKAKMLRHDSPMKSHPSTHFLLESPFALHYTGGMRSSSPQAFCAVRFADTQGVTPDMKDGMTAIDRCFAEE